MVYGTHSVYLLRLILLFVERILCVSRRSDSIPSYCIHSCCSASGSARCDVEISDDWVPSGCQPTIVIIHRFEVLT